MKVIVNGERELINVANWVYTKINGFTHKHV